MSAFFAAHPAHTHRAIPPSGTTSFTKRIRRPERMPAIAYFPFILARAFLAGSLPGLIDRDFSML